MACGCFSARSKSISRWLPRAHAGHRLVEQQQLRLGRQRHRDLELALLAMAERGDEGAGAISQADLRQQCARRFASRLGSSRAGAARKRKEWPWHAPDRERDVLERGEARAAAEVIWNDRPRPSRTRAWVGSAVTSRPAKRMVPEFGRSRR
jgi:hypothetical protein